MSECHHLARSSTSRTLRLSLSDSCGKRSAGSLVARGSHRRDEVGKLLRDPPHEGERLLHGVGAERAPLAALHVHVPDRSAPLRLAQRQRPYDKHIRTQPSATTHQPRQSPSQTQNSKVRTINDKKPINRESCQTHKSEITCFPTMKQPFLSNNFAIDSNRFLLLSAKSHIFTW